jgi:hypothetical protein
MIWFGTLIDQPKTGGGEQRRNRHRILLKWEARIRKKINTKAQWKGDLFPYGLVKPLSVGRLPELRTWIQEPKRKEIKAEVLEKGMRWSKWIMDAYLRDGIAKI